MSKKHTRDIMKRIVATACAALIVLAFVASVVVPAFAATQQEINDAKKKTENAKSDVKAAEEKKNKILEEYNAIDNQITEIESEIIILETQMTQTKEDIELKEKELKKAEKEYDDYEELFLTRARAMYENSDIKYLEILFGANSFSDFLSRMEMMTQIIEYDNSVLDKLEATKKKIEAAKKELEETHERQKEESKNLGQRKSALDNTLAQKQALLDEATKDIEAYTAIYEAAEAAEAKMIEENKAALSSSANPVEYSGGKLAWPTPGVTYITSYFGYRIHPVYGYRKYHSGIDIGAGYGRDIVASADGVVTLATTNGGYGRCVIINHGSGITTLYGHCSSLLVSSGQRVTRGQLIAKVGSTGVSTGPHLHYEVRVNGSATDPLSYLR